MDWEQSRDEDREFDPNDGQDIYGCILGAIMWIALIALAIFCR